MKMTKLTAFPVSSSRIKKSGKGLSFDDFIIPGILKLVEMPSGMSNVRGLNIKTSEYSFWPDPIKLLNKLGTDTTHSW